MPINPLTLGKTQNLNQSPEQSQNLLRQTSPERSIRPKVFYVLPVFEVLGVACAFFTALHFRIYLTGGEPVLMSLIGGSVLGIISSAAFLLTKHTARRAFVIILEAIALASLFVGGKGLSLSYLALAGAVMVVVRLWGEREGRVELTNCMEIQYFRVVKPVLGKFLSAGVLFAILIYMPQWDPKKEVVSESYFNQVFDASMNLVNKAYPQIKPDDTLTTTARDLALKKLEESTFWSVLNSDAQAKELSKATGEILKQLQDKLSFTVDPQEKLSAVVYRFVTNTVSEWATRAGQGFLIGFGVLLFFVFRGFGAILYIPLAIISFFVYQTLLAGNVIHIAGESRLKEEIEYS